MVTATALSVGLRKNLWHAGCEIAKNAMWVTAHTYVEWGGVRANRHAYHSIRVGRARDGGVKVRGSVAVLLQDLGKAEKEQGELCACAM